MDERARIPVSLPRPNPTQSYWQTPPADIADLRTTEDLPDSADTVIIGSGITGAAVAWHLLQGENPGSILMLEARQICSGATGRNDAATLGTSAAAQIALLEHANITALHEFARTHSIPCTSLPTPTLDVFFTPHLLTTARAAVTALQAALPPNHPAAEYTFLTPDEIHTHYHVHDSSPAPKGSNGEEEEGDKVHGGVLYSGGTLSGYDFVIGLLRICVTKGIGVHANTPVTNLTKNSDGKWTVETPRGVVTAKRVVLATNGYTARVMPEHFQGVVVPVRGQVTAQRPGRGMPMGGCLPATYSFVYEGGYEYMVTRPEGSRFPGDVVIGGGLARAPGNGLGEYGNTDDAGVNEGVSGYLRETAARYFGRDWGEDDPAGRVRSEWTGIMGFSPDGFPFVGEVPGEDGLWTSCSFQGNGMVLCWMCAKALVEMMEGRDGEELREWFPDVFRITEERLAQRFQGRLH